MLENPLTIIETQEKVRWQVIKRPSYEPTPPSESMSASYQYDVIVEATTLQQAEAAIIAGKISCSGDKYELWKVTHRMERVV